MRLSADVALDGLIADVKAIASELETPAQWSSGSEEAVMLRMSIKLRDAVKTAKDKR